VQISGAQRCYLWSEPRARGVALPKMDHENSKAKLAIVGAVTNATVCQEEILGPVLVATPYDDLHEVAALVNNTQHSLGASIWSNNLQG
jgi:acyl-CoA reductase-like NAD-dependent aldehyde dehydrogenase